jgi:hypothetical protein
MLRMGFTYDTPPLKGNCPGTLVPCSELCEGVEVAGIRSFTGYPKFLVANLLKGKIEGRTSIEARSRAVPFAAVAVKGLRYAAMNAQKARALDRRPRCGWLSVMRRMSSSHVSKNT